MSGIFERMILGGDATAKTQSENLKLIFPEKELRSLSSKFHIHMSVSDLYIPTIGLPILLQENMWTDPRKILGTEAAKINKKFRGHIGAGHINIPSTIT
jgi:hypothetical protein